MSTPVTHIWRPSIARRVVLDGFVPVPRGVSANPTVLVWPAKDPADVLDYELDITAALAGNDTDTIATVDVLTTPADLICTTTAADGNLVILWLSAGTAGITYSVRVTVGTSGGRSIARAIQLPVQSLAASAPPASSLTNGAGTAITDQNGNPILIGS